MSLYPTLEDLHVDKMVRSQQVFEQQILQQGQALQSPTSTASGVTAYPDLMDFMGLELSSDVIRQNMPEYSRDLSQIGANAPVSGAVSLPARSQVTHGIKEYILCKGADGKVGVRVQAINTGIFVSIVVKDSPAALAGLRFGDQILQLNGTLVAGFSVDKIHKMLKESDKNNISVVVRDRPFERTITLFKDSTGHLGFQFKDGKITSIVQNSSAARNGVLTDHNLLEVNGQTVVAMKDKDITKIIEAADEVVKITIIPKFIYDHMIKKLSTSFLRGIMDHSVPDF